MSNSYRNPFGGVNAAQLKVDAILEYWCDPFLYGMFSEIMEDDLFQDTNNILFMGGRSTGKSMFLRYWSYPVQFRIAEKENTTLINIVKKNDGIGFYFRIDGPILRTFQGRGLSEEHWSSVFTHYFELLTGRQYIEALKLLQDEGSKSSINQEINNSNIIQKLNNHLDFKGKNSLSAIIQEFDKRIFEIDTFRSNVEFFKKEFIPQERAYSSQYLSFGIPEIIINTLPSLKDINILILLDEYENFLEYQQIVINTLLRFTKPQIRFRIGMRLEGFKTFKMTSEEDFIKEGREYRKVMFKEILNKDTKYNEFLIEVARKRLELVPALKDKNFTDIREILSQSENLEEEALTLSKKDPDKIYKYFSKKLPKDTLDKVRCPENPLMELLNFIWLTRGVSVEKTEKSMREFLIKKRTEDAKKYKLDYVDKYKLSLLFLLCSIYRKNKLYYSFNTFSFLSSGIVGHFIELCRRAFSIAGWGDNDRLLLEGSISAEFQSKAAMEFSIAEKAQISRIENYGETILRFIDNIGNIFRDCHLDFRMRYPETNQFAINIDTIQNKELRDAMKAAIKWSVIQQKPRMQRSGPGEHLQVLYIINRIFSPNFQISYRTRGGMSISLDEKALLKLMVNEKVKSSEFLSSEKEKKNNPTLF